jgi:cytochrome P450
MLLLAQDEAGTGRMTDEQVRDEALTIFLAGQESTAVALTWTWYLVSQHPEIDARLHTELAHVLGGRAPSVEDLPQLRYTEMVFSEAMRLYPPAWSIGRTALKPFEVCGYTIPSGSLVLTPPYVVHRDPRWFPDPERFDPERWTSEEKAKRPKFSYFPFGGGARVCIGDRFAWMEGVLLLAAIAQKWRFELSPGHPVAYRAVITLRARYGMHMIARTRQESDGAAASVRESMI